MADHRPSTPPLVSFVIPVYNQGRFVARAIDSVLAQTLRAVELVVVDDGSTDDTRDVLATFRGRRGVTVITQPNAGVVAARNRGLAEASGVYVCFLDADDLVAIDYAARLSSVLEEDPALAFAYADIQEVDADDAPSGTFSVTASRKALAGDILPSLLIGGYFPPHAGLIRRSVLDELGGFTEGLGGNADYELWLRLSAAGRTAAYVDEKLAFYRRYAGSMSGDVQEMRRTRALAIDGVARRFPARVARAIASLQDLTADLHAANTYLTERWDGAFRALESGQFRNVWSLLEHFGDATLVEGAPEKLGVWDATIDGMASRAVFLHPASTLRATIPTGAAGRLTTSVAIHPDAWTKPRAGTCQFSVTVDGTAAASVILNPRERDADRRWVEIALDVPASDTGRHMLALDTRAVGPDFYCWALFRDARFGF